MSNPQSEKEIINNEVIVPPKVVTIHFKIDEMLHHVITCTEEVYPLLEHYLILLSSIGILSNNIENDIHYWFIVLTKKVGNFTYNKLQLDNSTSKFTSITVKNSEGVVLKVINVEQ